MADLRGRVEGLRELLLELFRLGEVEARQAARAHSMASQVASQAAKAEGDDVAAQWKSYAQQLSSLGAMERDRQMVELARGLRLCQMTVGRRRPKRKKLLSASASPLEHGVDSLPGIGPAMAERLADKGLETVEDLVWLVPRRYDDVRNVQSLAEVLRDPPIGERVSVRGRIQSVRFVRRGRRGWVDLRMHDPEGSLVVRWFNAHAGMSKRFEEGGFVTLAGRLSQRAGVCEMANPDVLAIESPTGDSKVLVSGIVPRYAEVAGVPPTTLRKACQAAVQRGASFLVDRVPEAVRGRLDLCDLQAALLTLHAPPATLSQEEALALNSGLSAWHRRLAFEELFALAVLVARRRAELRSDRARAFAPNTPGELEAALPYRLTGAQRRCIDTIASDLAREQPMNRLLQGDVGAGKTAVALAGALQVIRGGGQVALMAPTEILAEQHERSMQELAPRLGIKIALLTASTPREIRATTVSLLAAGAIDLLVGTHSLLSEDVQFKELGLVVIDEQHRFGVAQRARLRSKGGGRAAHLLVMTATPIPRTLALTAYGDLDVSVLDELPPGRQPPRTQVLEGSQSRSTAYRALRKRLEQGQRAYVVCPLVEPAEEESGRIWADATSVHRELAGALSPHAIGLVHGRMSRDERQAVMSRFRSGEVMVLVSTTVIEVGVDVPEAVVMLVEDADHFGLAQLHQLRGRVGRGGGASECVLLTTSRASEDGCARLAILAASFDGFEIAERDLLMRGPGELLGVRQAGLPRLRFGSLQEHGELLLLARREADALCAIDPMLDAPEHGALRGYVEAHFESIVAFAEDGG